MKFYECKIEYFDDGAENNTGIWLGLSRWKAWKTAFSPVACLGAVAWKKADRTKREGGVMSPGIPCNPPPPPNAVSVRSPISRE